ncbi:hypothetical protein SAMN05421754_11006 [Nitrosomonas sp. Nm58]|jgi:hypothetical protein|nr:hypothetical protein SAMN05421754_11006 [Nitrosomonas sp. Nm58]
MLGIKAMEGGSGRTPIAPEILFALWLYATVEGAGSARMIERLTERLFGNSSFRLIAST